MLGKCLCGAVQFNIDKTSLKAYQCHCSLCRKQSGTYSNLGSIIPKSSFRFLQGSEEITSWVKENGFRSDFCSRCGSPVPNILRDTEYYWIPIGLLEHDENIELISHIYLNSKAHWEKESPNAERHLEFPGLEQHIRTLNE